MAKLTLEIWDLDDGTGAIAVKCSSDVDIETAKITPAIIVMSTIIATLQEGDETDQTPVPIKTRTH